MSKKINSFNKTNLTSNFQLLASKQNGITLIALIITIVIMLILATVTISAINGGLFEYAGKAKTDTEEVSKVTGIKESYIIAKGESKTGRIITEDMQNALDKVLGKDYAEALDNSGQMVVRIEDKFYDVDSNGNVGEGKKIEPIANAGDITKTGNGTKENPYKIRCIEDLVAFSKNVNTGTAYTNKFICLEKDLDFNSIFSYSNYAAKYSYNSAQNAYIPNEDSDITIKELCTTGQGFIPIGNATNGKAFGGIFYGREQHEIKNIYIKRSDNAALFGYARNSIEIKNIIIDGTITCTGSELAAGFIGSIAPGYSLKMESCINKATIENTGTGGAVGVTVGPYSGRPWYNN